jgi:antagonist of KipI
MSLKILRAGIFDTIQDEGRNHFRNLGITANGPMDSFSAELANALLGKDPHAPVIEMHFPASSLLFEKSTVICLAGADFSPRINGQQVPIHHPLFIPANTVLEFAKMISGSWCYLSLLHDLEISPWLGSYSTNTKVNAGGFHGRTLKQNDRIAYKENANLEFNENEVIRLHWQSKDLVAVNNHELLFLKGNEWNWLDADAIENFLSTRFRISSQSDRMGYRLEGERLYTKENIQLVSSAVCAGTIQLLPNGQLIVLMADHQTTGGYPRIGYISTSTLPVLAQQQPGNFVKFKLTTLAEAEEKIISRQHFIDELKMTCHYRMKNFLHVDL